MRGHLARIALIALVAGTALPAQFDNPEKKIKEIVDDVAKQMQEIDKLLLKTRPESLSSAAEGAKKVTEKIDELLDQTGKSQGEVVSKIDELIKEIQKLQSQGGQGQQQQQQQDQQQQRGNQRRRENQNPDMQRQDDQQQGNQPRDGRDQQRQSENRPSQPRPEDPTESVNPKRDSEAWGTLPLYEQLMKSRGGAPDVPEKYRKFHEAFLKSQNREHKSGH